MKRKFITNLILVLSLNILIKPFWIFGIDRTVQVLVGENEYGFYFSLYNLSFLLNILLDMGITNFNNRDISQHHQLLSKYLSNIFGLKLILAVVYMFICLSFGFSVGYDKRQFGLLIILILNQFLASFILYFRSNISGLQFFRTDSMLSVLDRAIMIILCSLLIWTNLFGQPFRIEWFAYAQTISYGLVCIICFFIVLSKSEFFRIQFDKKYILILLKRSFPFALLVLFMGIYNYVDAVMLERLLPDGKYQAGVYAQAFRIFYALTMFGLLFAGLLLPMFSRMIKLKQPVGELTKLSSLLIVIPSAIIITACIFYRNEIIRLLYPNHSAESPVVFAILITGFLSVCTTYIFGTLLTANGNLKELNWMALGGVVICMLLNFILIPQYKAIGSAVASLVTQTITALVQVYLAIKIFKFRVQKKLFLQFILFFTGLILLGFAFKNIPLSWHYSILLFILVCGLFAVSIRLLNLKSILQVIKTEEEENKVL